MEILLKGLVSSLCESVTKSLNYLKEQIARSTNPAGNYMFKVNNRNTKTRCEICSKLTIKTPERR